jgi:hypothetical protein
MDGADPLDEPDDADWGQVLLEWIGSIEDERYVEIIAAVLVDDPLYCAAFNSFQSAIAEAAPPAGLLR